MKFGVCPITSYINSDYLQKCMTYLNADTDITYTDWNIPREKNQVDLRKKLKTVLLLKRNGYSKATICTLVWSVIGSTSHNKFWEVAKKL